MGTNKNETAQLNEIVLLSNAIVEQKEQDIKHKQQIALFHALTAEYATIKVSIEADEVDVDGEGRTAKEKTKDKKRLKEIPLLIEEAKAKMSSVADGMDTVSTQALKLLEVSVADTYPSLKGEKRTALIDFITQEKRTADDITAFCLDTTKKEPVLPAAPKRSSLIVAKLAAIVVSLGELMKGIDSLLFEIEGAINELRSEQNVPANVLPNNESVSEIETAESVAINVKPQAVSAEDTTSSLLFSSSLESLEKSAVDASADTASMGTNRNPVPFPGVQR